MSLSIDLQHVYPFFPKAAIDALEDKANNAKNLLLSKKGPGNEFLGWVSLPEENTSEHLDKIQQTAFRLQKQSDAVVVVGIGGSYLGARAVIDALSPYFPKESTYPEMLYAGHHLSQEYLKELLDYLQDKSFSVIVISKSGTTTEPALAFRFLKKALEAKYTTQQVKERIVAITDKSKGALRQLAEEQGYETFIIPDNVGGRYSVLTPVGLLPIAVAGHNIHDLNNGALEMNKLLRQTEAAENPALQYAIVRNLLYRNGKAIELLINYTPKLATIAEWWKQLFGESEGKAHKGIFPASASFSTDLHSLGQLVQEGVRNIFETLIHIEQPQYELTLPGDKQNLDNLNYLQEKPVDFVNKQAEKATTLAHVEGRVPNIILKIDNLCEHSLGELLFFFEFSCAVSGYMLEVNPFDQPGVEAYKRNMFALLGKPGFEEEREALQKKINQS